MSELRHQIAEAMEKMAEDTLPPAELATHDARVGYETGDEVIDAMLRQLDVLEGHAVVMANMANLLLVQVGNLRQELGLLAEPPQPVAPTAAPQAEVERTPSGAVLASVVPEEKRQGMLFCGHPDALIVTTTEGPQIVCDVEDCPNHG